jgi:acyl carrier protein
LRPTRLNDTIRELYPSLGHAGVDPGARQWVDARVIDVADFVALGISNCWCKGSRMTDQEILAKFTRILRDLLYDDSIELTMDTERENVPNWDSFNYVNFIVAVEREFGVRFKVGDIASFANVGAIVKETEKMLA